MKRSTSATSSLLASRASRAVASKVLTATLKVSLPFILTYCCRPASMASDAGRREPPPGPHTKSQRSPSERKWVDRTPRSSSEGSSKAAPAPRGSSPAPRGPPQCPDRSWPRRRPRPGARESRSVRRSTHRRWRPCVQDRYCAGCAEGRPTRWPRCGPSSSGVLALAIEEGHALLDVALDVFVHVPLEELLGHADRVFDGPARRPAVTDDADAVDTQEERAAELGIIHPPLEPGERALEQRVADPAQQRTGRDLLEEHFFHGLGHAFGDLEGHVPDEAVAHHDVCCPGEDVTPFDVPDEVQRALLQLLEGLLGHLVPFRVLLPDAEETDGGMGSVKDVLGVLVPHERELGQL